MSDEEDEKVEVQVVVAGHGGLRVDSLTGQRKGGAPLNSERLAKMPLQSGQSTITAAFKKQKMMATEGAMEVEGVEMTTFSSTITTNTSTSGRTPASAIATLPVTSSSGSTSKRQRGIGGDGVGGYHHEVLLPPSKDAAKEASGVEALSGAVEHIAAAVASKVETSVGEVVDRATVQLKECGVVVIGNQADAQGEVADFFYSKGPPKIEGKRKRKKRREREREKEGGCAPLGSYLAF